MDERPFDFLNRARGKRVLIELSDGEVFSGMLVCFDSNHNIVIEAEHGSRIFIRSFHGQILVYEE